MTTCKSEIPSTTESIELLSSSSIFLLPSRREGFGLAALEAMAHGVPCILTDLPALKEKFGEAAIFVPTNDAESLANGILNLLDDQERQQRMAADGVKLARSLSWDVVAAKEALVIYQAISRMSLVRSIRGMDFRSQIFVRTERGEEVGFGASW